MPRAGKGTNTLSYLLRQMGRQRAFPNSKERIETDENGNERVIESDRRSKSSQKPSEAKPSRAT